MRRGAFPALALDGVERRYGRGETTVEVLNGASFALSPGQSVALIAPSGAGKSTLLHVAGLLERPNAGEVTVGGVGGLDPDGRRAHGAETQPDRLRLPVPSSAAGILGAREPRPAADDRGPHARGGGDAARASCSATSASRRARTIGPRNFPAASSSASPSPARVANGPRVLLADEPTGNLDPKTADHVFATLAALVRATGLAALIATHNMDLAARMDRRVTIRDGRVSEMASSRAEGRAKRFTFAAPSEPLTGPASWRKRRAPGRGLGHDRRSAWDRFCPARLLRAPARRLRPVHGLWMAGASRRASSGTHWRT